MNERLLKYVRWAIDDALKGKFEEAKRSLTWAQEEEDKIQQELKEKQTQEHKHIEDLTFQICKNMR